MSPVYGLLHSRAMLRYGFTGQAKHDCSYGEQLDTERNTSEFTEYAGYKGSLPRCIGFSGSLPGFILRQPVFVSCVTVRVDETDYLIDVAGSLAPKKSSLSYEIHWHRYIRSN